MTRFWLLIATLLLLFTGMFVVAEQLNLPLLEDPYGTIGASGSSAAIIGVSLLIADVILPVPSSLIMIANGALFGVPLGAFLSLVGSLGAAVAGYLLGRSGSSLTARLIRPEEQARANRLLEKYGLLAIILTRPIPLLAETTAIVAGMSEMKLRSVALAALAGALPSALLYAITGATAANLNSAVLAFGLVLLITGLFWLASRQMRSTSTNDSLTVAKEEIL